MTTSQVPDLRTKEWRAIKADLRRLSLTWSHIEKLSDASKRYLLSRLKSELREQ